MLNRYRVLISPSRVPIPLASSHQNIIKEAQRRLSSDPSGLVMAVYGEPPLQRTGQLSSYCFISRVFHKREDVGFASPPLIDFRGHFVHILPGNYHRWNDVPQENLPSGFERLKSLSIRVRIRKKGQPPVSEVFARAADTSVGMKYSNCSRQKRGLKRPAVKSGRWPPYQHPIKPNASL